MILTNSSLSNSYCRPVKKCGGSEIFVNNNLNHKPLTNINDMPIEVIFEVTASHILDCTVVVFYRPGTTDKGIDTFVNRLSCILNYISKINGILHAYF